MSITVLTKSEVKRNYIPYIDNLYAIGVILVLLGHSHSNDWNTFSGTILEAIINEIYLFHMPLFFFIAGFLFTRSNRIEKDGYVNWIKEKAMKLLTPYVVLSLIVAVPKYYLGHGSFIGMWQSLSQGILSPKLGVWGPFWFVRVLFLTYLFFGMMRQYMEEKMMLIVSLLLSLALYFSPITTLLFGLSDIKVECIFFVVGMLTQYYIFGKDCRINCNVRIILILAAILSIYFFQTMMKQNTMVLLILALLLIFVCWQISILIGDNKFCTFISKRNLTIYIYSWPFQAVAMIVCDRVGLPWYFTTPIMFIIGLAMPIVMIIIYEKMSFLHNRFFDLVLGLK